MARWLIPCPSAIEHGIHFGGQLAQEWCYQRTGISTIELVHSINEACGYELDVNGVREFKHRRFEELLDGVRPHTAVVNVALAHQNQIPQTIASEGARHTVDANLNVIGITHIFQEIITIEDVSRSKPNPELFLTAADHLNVKPIDCIDYGDSEVGFMAAQAAGMRLIDVRPVILL